MVHVTTLAQLQQLAKMTEPERIKNELDRIASFKLQGVETWEDRERESELRRRLAEIAWENRS